MAKEPGSIQVGEDFQLKEIPRWRVVLSVVFWGVIASLLAALLTWCIGGFVVPQACYQIGDLLNNLKP